MSAARDRLMADRPTLHLVKLAQGIESPAALRRAQLRRLRAGNGRARLTHFTRNRPVRTPELLDGGSIYWVVRGYIAVRQRLLDIVDATNAHGREGVNLVFHPDLVATEPRRLRAFQGWRYLEAGRAPPDRDLLIDPGLPDTIARDLYRLGLL